METIFMQILQGIRNSLASISGRSNPHGHASIKVKLFLPSHANKRIVLWTQWQLSKCSSEISFGHNALQPQLCNSLHHRINSRIGKLYGSATILVLINTIIYRMISGET